MTPFSGKNTVTSPFGPRTSPITGAAEQHKGQDITTSGDWTVRECTGGTVLRVASDRWRGNYVDVETAPGVFERYQHMERIDVKAGQKLAQGDALGLAGSTGQVTGRHLHFEVQKSGAAVDPAPWSDVPNQTGAWPGNDHLDGPAASPSGGDEATGGTAPGDASPGAASCECGICLAQVEAKLDKLTALVEALTAGVGAAAALAGRALGGKKEADA